MRISVQACIEGEGERPSRIITVGVIERDDEFAPSSGLGLFMSETKALLKQLQTVFVDEQVDRFFDVSNYVVTSYVQGDTLYFDCIVNFRDGVLRETFIRTCRQFSKNIEKGLSQVNVDDTFVLRPGKTEPEDEEAP